MKKRLVLTKDTRIYHHPTCFAGNREIKYDHKGLLSFFFFYSETRNIFFHWCLEDPKHLSVVSIQETHNIWLLKTGNRTVSHSPVRHSLKMLRGLSTQQILLLADVLFYCSDLDNFLIKKTF